MMDRASNFVSLESVHELFLEDVDFRDRVLRIAERLEALHEYHREQAVLVAADLVLSGRAKRPNSGIAKGTDAVSPL